MELFAIIDKALLGRGVFGVFSDFERADNYLREHLTVELRLCEIRKLNINRLLPSGATITALPDDIFVAYVYDPLHDQVIFEGLYSHSLTAREAVGDRGLVVKFRIDAPGTREIVDNE